MFLNFIVFGKQVSFEAPDDEPMKDTIIKALEFYQMPQGRPYKLRFWSNQGGDQTPKQLGLKRDDVVELVDAGTD